jgi:hypothetical protein
LNTYIEVRSEFGHIDGLYRAAFDGPMLVRFSDCVLMTELVLEADRQRGPIDDRIRGAQPIEIQDYVDVRVA